MPYPSFNLIRKHSDIVFKISFIECRRKPGQMREGLQWIAPHHGLNSNAAQIPLVRAMNGKPAALRGAGRSRAHAQL